MADPKMLHPTTEYNIDTDSCDFETMFKTEKEYKIFRTIVLQECYLKQQCEIDPLEMKLKIMNDETSEVESERTYKLSQLIKKKCFERIYEDQKTSPFMVMIAGCVKDYVTLPNKQKTQLHIEEIGLIAVSVDILSILLMFFIFYKINKLNEEYI